MSAKKCNITVDGDLCIWLYDYYLVDTWYCSWVQRPELKGSAKEGDVTFGAPDWLSLGIFRSIRVALLLSLSYPDTQKLTPCYVKNLGALINRRSEAAERSREVPAVDFVCHSSKRRQ